MSEQCTNQQPEWPLPGHDQLPAETQAMLERMHKIAPESAVSIAGMRISIAHRQEAIQQRVDDITSAIPPVSPDNHNS